MYQPISAYVKHTVVRGVEEDVVLKGKLLEGGKIVWDDPHNILKDPCAFVHIQLYAKIKEAEA